MSLKKLTKLLSSPKEAKEMGEKYYYTGKPCKNGHYSPRYVENRNCYDCLLEKGREWRSENKDYFEKYNKEYKETHADFISKSHSDWYWNRGGRDIRKRYRDENSDWYREVHRRWDRENKPLRNFHTANYRSKKKNATPKWANNQEIKYVYSLAKEKGQVVDHIVPLQSDYVCGLHCGDNLRVIPSNLNSYKSNRYWPNMWALNVS